MFLEINSNEISLEQKLTVSKKIEEIRQDDQKIVDYINSGLPTIRQNIKTYGGRHLHKKRDFKYLWKQFISDLVGIYSKNNCDTKYYLTEDEKVWDRFECLILVWNDFFKHLELSKRKFEVNDWQDLINFVYVQPGMKYWTNENKWNDLLLQNRILNKYLFP